MEYYGVVTGKRYVADIVVKIDSSNKDSWEVLNIEYADTNTGVTPNVKKIQELIKEMNDRLAQFPGMDLNFSQNIQDNVEEAMSGVKCENSLKLFGDDLDTLTSLANKIQQVMKSVPGVTDVGVFKVGGQPSLVIQIDRARAARPERGRDDPSRGLIMFPA